MSRYIALFLVSGSIKKLFSVSQYFLKKILTSRNQWSPQLIKVFGAVDHSFSKHASFSLKQLLLTPYFVPMRIRGKESFLENIAHVLNGCRGKLTGEGFTWWYLDARCLHSEFTSNSVVPCSESFNGPLNSCLLDSVKKPVMISFFFHKHFL